MYNLKRILEKMVMETGKANSNSDPDVMGEALDNLCSLVTEAVVEIDIAEEASVEQPQEMRDFFAGAALVGILMRDRDQDDNPVRIQDSWAYSDAMMVERSKRIEARKAVQP